MIQRFSFIFCVFAYIITASSCSSKPSIVLSKNEMIDVMSDINLAHAIYNSEPSFRSNDAQKKALIANILDKHNITQAELDSSILWYADNIKIYIEINDSISARLRRQGQALQTERDIAMRGSNTQYDVLPHFFYLNDVTPTLSFTLDSIKIKTVNLSSFNFHFTVTGLSILQQVNAGIYYTYKDTLVKEIIPITDNKQYNFHKPNLPDSLLINISGYIHLKHNQNTELPFIIIHDIQYLDSVSYRPDLLENKQEDSAESEPKGESLLRSRGQPVDDTK